MKLKSSALIICLLLALTACDVVNIALDTTPGAITNPTPIKIGPANNGTTSNGAPTPASGSTTTDSAWYRLYFTNPPDQYDADSRSTDTVVEKVVASLNAATRSIDATTYDFDLPAMADALIAAHDRGLVVRLVTDTDTMGEAVIKKIKKDGIKVIEDHRSAIMHDKFVIVDGLVVWTGSWNFSENDNYKNNNNFIGIASPQMVANYQTEFNELFERQEFGPTSTADTPYPTFTVNGTLIENYFAPEDDVEDHIVATLKNAQHSVYFAAFTFTSQPISQTLVDLAKSGVTIQGIYEKRQVSAGSDQSYNLLTAAKLPVLLDGNRYTMHDKYFVIDQQLVITGSFNFTKAANTENDENLLILHNPQIAAQYYQDWQKIWAKAGGQ